MPITNLYFKPIQTWAPLHKTTVNFTINDISAIYGNYHWFLDFDWLWSSVAMVVTIDCRNTINYKVTIVLCNRALVFGCAKNSLTPTSTQGYLQWSHLFSKSGCAPQYPWVALSWPCLQAGLTWQLCCKPHFCGARLSSVKPKYLARAVAQIRSGSRGDTLFFFLDPPPASSRASPEKADDRGGGGTLTLFFSTSTFWLNFPDTE